MSGSRRFYYLRKKDSLTLTNTTLSGEAVDSMFFTESSSNNNNLNGNSDKHNNNNNNDNNEEEERDNDDSEFMPYTPNSVDRSSVGSIPWADDAIKQNQMYWERIERMLAGEEQALPEETELAQEVAEWQHKFPQFLRPSSKKTRSLRIQQHNLNDSLDIDALSDLSFDDDDDDDAEEESLVTPTLKYPKQLAKMPIQNPIYKTQRLDSVGDLAQQLSRNLRISSVPLTWHQQVKYAKNETISNSTSAANSPGFAPRPPPPPRRHSPTFNSLLIAPSKPKMPPPVDRIVNTNQGGRGQIMQPLLGNVLESKRRFRGLANNRSFVQLTAAKQTKSAALTQQNSGQPRNAQQNTWHMPLAAATVGRRFFNQRNSVILPSLNLQRIHEQRITEVPSSASSSSSMSRKGLNSLPVYNTKANYGQPYHLQPREYVNRSSFSSITPSTSGRSISAAVHHPRFELNAFYLPYSAANKFKSFNKI